MIQIIGDGISGLATALTLQKNNVDYELFEKGPQITYDNVGLGIIQFINS
jgi:protoporphyrinogen oxidase